LQLAEGREMNGEHAINAQFLSPLSVIPPRVPTSNESLRTSPTFLVKLLLLSLPLLCFLFLLLLSLGG
jgi:hypothetical protein